MRALAWLLVALASPAFAADWTVPQLFEALAKERPGILESYDRNPHRATCMRWCVRDPRANEERMRGMRYPSWAMSSAICGRGSTFCGMPARTAAPGMP